MVIAPPTSDFGDDLSYWCVLRRVAGWVAGACWDDDITNVMPKIPCLERR